MENKVINWNFPIVGNSSYLDGFHFDKIRKERVIVCDPVSIAHLLSNTSTYQTAVQSEQMRNRTRLLLDDKSTENRIVNAVNTKVIDLVRFLVDGGLLIYFLRPYFTIVNEERDCVFDNYCWLDTLRPMIPQTGLKRIESNGMSNLEICAELSKSPWASYLQFCQDFDCLAVPTSHLTPDYYTLATLEDNLSISCGLSFGGAGSGGILALPAPTSLEHKKLFVSALNSYIESGSSIGTVLPPKSREFSSCVEVPSGIESPLISLRKLKENLLAHKTKETPLEEKVNSDLIALEYESLLDLILYQSPEEIIERLARLFEQGGWQIVTAESTSEIYIGNAKEELFILRVSTGDGDELLKDLSHLARSIIVAWAEQEYEPQGLLISITRDYFKTTQKLRGIEFDAAAFAQRNNIKLIGLTELARLLKSTLNGSITAADVCTTLTGVTQANENLSPPPRQEKAYILNSESVSIDG